VESENKVQMRIKNKYNALLKFAKWCASLSCHLEPDECVSCEAVAVLRQIGEIQEREDDK
jgi:hypothetical protein